MQKDSIQLAQEIIDAIRSKPNTLNLQTEIYEKVYELRELAAREALAQVEAKIYGIRRMDYSTFTQDLK